MKKYPHIISKLFYEPLLVTRARHAAICQVVESHMAKVEMIGPDVPDSNDRGYVALENTAIISVCGTLVGHAADIPASSCGCGCDEIAMMIDIALADPSVARMIFNFNTPGGSVTGIPELGRKIAGIVSKETIAFTDSECCSGGMWLAAQCQRFYATESSTVGSIGVWCAFLDLSKQMHMAGENLQEFSAGKYKTMGGFWKSLTKEESIMIQESVDKIYGQFKEAVQKRRQVADEFMQGQTFDGPEAVEAGLIDGLVEGLDELITDQAVVV
jgi:signal peptide peptidase SppA